MSGRMRRDGRRDPSAAQRESARLEAEAAAMEERLNALRASLASEKRERMARAPARHHSKAGRRRRGGESAAEAEAVHWDQGRPGRLTSHAEVVLSRKKVARQAEADRSNQPATARGRGRRRGRKPNRDRQPPDGSDGGLALVATGLDQERTQGGVGGGGGGGGGGSLLASTWNADATVVPRSERYSTVSARRPDLGGRSTLTQRERMRAAQGEPRRRVARQAVSAGVGTDEGADGTAPNGWDGLDALDRPIEADPIDIIARVPAGSATDGATSAGGAAADGGTGGLLAGEFNEDESHAGFAAALQEWRTAQKTRNSVGIGGEEDDDGDEPDARIGVYEAVAGDDRLDANQLVHDGEAAVDRPDGIGVGTDDGPGDDGDEGGLGGTLIAGAFDEAESHASFARALEDWRRSQRLGGDADASQRAPSLTQAGTGGLDESDAIGEAPNTAGGFDEAASHNTFMEALEGWRRHQHVASFAKADSAEPGSDIGETGDRAFFVQPRRHRDAAVTDPMTPSNPVANDDAENAAPRRKMTYAERLLAKQQQREIARMQAAAREQADLYRNET